MHAISQNTKNGRITDNLMENIFFLIVEVQLHRTEKMPCWSIRFFFFILTIHFKKEEVQ